MGLPGRSVRRPVAVSMLFAAVVLLGLISAARLPVDLLPDLAYPKLVVHTGYPGVGPAEVERFITERVEEQVARVPGVREVESVSREGVSLVTVRFVWGTDMDFAALHARERLQALDAGLPSQANRPVLLRADPRSEPIMALSLGGRSDPRALQELAESVFRRRLEQIDGVAQVAVTGGVEREIQVEVDARALEAYGITLDEVAEALEAANASLPGGTVRRGRLRYPLRTLGELETAEQIGGVVVKSGTESAGAGEGGGVVTVSDVAVVRDAFEDRASIARYDRAETVGLLLFKESGANTVRVAEKVDAVLEELRREYEEVGVAVAMSRADFIADAVSSVIQSLILGGGLAFLVLFLFLRDVRYPVAVALAIPVSVIGTFGLLDLAGASLDIMSLGGLALGVGMLVDNSIVVLENISRHRRLHASALDPEAPDPAVVGTEEVQGAITASTLTTISVFAPLLYVEGVAGQLFRPLSLAVASSLLVSLLVALTLLPALAARWQPQGVEPRRRHAPTLRGAGWVVGGAGRVLRRPLRSFDLAFDRFAAWYHRQLDGALRHRRWAALGVGVLLVAAAALTDTLDRTVLPGVDEGSFRVRVALAKGTPLAETDALVSRLETLLTETPGVDAVFSQVGRRSPVAGLGEGETGPHTATLDVRIDGASTDRVLSLLRPGLRRFPPGALSISTGPAAALGRLLGGSDADLAVRVRGEELGGALAYARSLERVLSGLPSLANVRLGVEPGRPEVQIEIDRERAAEYGIETRRIARTVERSMLGAEATQLVAFDRKVPVVVRLPRADRRSLATLDELRVDGVPLRELVRTRESLGPSEIRRLDQGRVVPVLADVAGSGLAGAVADIRAALESHPAPRGLRVEIGGENQELRRSVRELGFAFGLAMLLVYMILAAQLESFVQPLVILVSVPLALMGAAVALWVAGAGLNTMSLIGGVVLVGIVVNDAIIKLDFINRARARGASVHDAILEAGAARLRPILMTTVTTVLGLMPMALGLGRGADLRAPLAVAVIGGLLAGTALTLIVVPVAYDLVEEARLRLLRLTGRRRGPGGPVGAERGPANAPAGPGLAPSDPE